MHLTVVVRSPRPIAKAVGRAQQVERGEAKRVAIDLSATSRWFDGSCDFYS